MHNFDGGDEKRAGGAKRVLRVVMSKIYRAMGRDYSQSAYASQIEKRPSDELEDTEQIDDIEMNEDSSINFNKILILSWFHPAIPEGSRRIFKNAFNRTFLTQKIL